MAQEGSLSEVSVAKAVKAVHEVPFKMTSDNFGVDFAEDGFVTVFFPDVENPHQHSGEWVTFKLVIHASGYDSENEVTDLEA